MNIQGRIKFTNNYLPILIVENVPTCFGYCPQLSSRSTNTWRHIQRCYIAWSYTNCKTFNGSRQL